MAASQSPASVTEAFSAIDHAHMARALRLAEHGLTTTQPNPRVGCVIARDNGIVGEGWHKRAGQAHAEVFALAQAGESARGACAFVTLEPCAHFGRTPPCADALIAAGVTRVVVAIGDPNPKVDGGGLQRLRDAGINVETGLMRDAAFELNRGFFSRITRNRPWLRIKLAMSLDGRSALANGVSQWITSPAARADVQRWRARSSAILTGSGTLHADNPRLTVRVAKPDDGNEIIASNRDAAFTPLRVVLDRQLLASKQSNLFDGSVPTLVFHAHAAQPMHNRIEQVEHIGVNSDACGLDLPEVLHELATRGVNELQVEAGARLCGAFFAAGLVDELLLYVAPIFLGHTACALLQLPGIDNMSAAARWRVIERRQVGVDQRIVLRP